MDAKTCQALRKKVEWTQTDLANALGVNRVTVTRWETGANPITEPMGRLIQRVIDDELKRRKKKRRR